MAFWGASDRQKEAEAFFPEQGKWNQQQYKDFLDRARRMGYTSDELIPWASKYFQDVATHGYGTPYDAQQWGDVIMPGRQAVIDARTGRLANIGQDFTGTFGTAQDRLGAYGGAIGQNYDALQGDVNDVFGGIGRRSEAGTGDITSNIAGTYGGAQAANFDTINALRRGGYATFDPMRDQTAELYGGLQGRSTGRFNELGGASDETIRALQDRAAGRFGSLNDRMGGMYGGMQGDVNATIGGLQGGNRGAYGEVDRTLQMMNPRGDTMAAQAARAFGPQMVSTLGRLRAAGIDPNSPEAASMLRNVESARSRSVQDAYGTASREYVDRANAATLGEEGVNRDLGLEGLRQRQGLGIREEEIGRGLGQTEQANYQQLALGGLSNQLALGQGELMNNQGLATDAGGIQRGIATQRLQNDQGLALGGLNTDIGLRLGAGQDYRNEAVRNLQQNNQMDLSRLGMNAANRNQAFDRTGQWVDASNNLDLQGWNTRAGLGRELNQNDIQNYQFNVLDPYNLGTQYLQQTEAAKSRAGGQLMGAGFNAAEATNRAAQTARGFGSDAAQNYGRVYDIEAPRAGWGTKLIASAAMGALTGGAGAYFSGAPIMSGIGRGALGNITGQNFGYGSPGVSGGNLGATGGISPWEQMYPGGSQPPAAAPQPYGGPYPTQYGQGQGGSNPGIFSIVPRNYKLPGRR